MEVCREGLPDKRLAEGRVDGLAEIVCNSLSFGVGQAAARILLRQLGVEWCG